MNLTQHFSSEEFTHTDHTDLQELNSEKAKDYKVNMSLVAAQLEGLRAFIARPIIINSGFRCPELNDRVKGSKSSQHLTGDAADFTVKDFDDITGLNFIFEWCKRHLNYGQLILENPPNSKPWIHIGMPREGKEKTMFVFENGVYKQVY